MLKRLFHLTTDKPPAELIKLRREIEMTRTNLELAMANFDQAVDPTMIDCYIYEINSLQKRYKHLCDLSAMQAVTVTNTLNQHSPIRALVRHVFG